MMKLWLISQSENRDYDTFDSAVVVADSPEDARRIHPDYIKPDHLRMEFVEPRMSDPSAWNDCYSSWCSSPALVKATLIGHTDAFPAGTIICASFNAG